jgi:hypothetical protein
MNSVVYMCFNPLQNRFLFPYKVDVFYFTPYNFFFQLPPVMFFFSIYPPPCNIFSITPLMFLFFHISDDVACQQGDKPKFANITGDKMMES